MDALQKLQESFQGIVPEEQIHKWDTAWKEGITPWDRKTPSLALVDALDEKTEIFGSSLNDKSTKQRKRALVPGCGGGYDVFLFASHGYDAYGLDVSPTALKAAQTLRDDPQLEQQYPVKNHDIGRGQTQFVNGNFFEDNFLTQTGGKDFDVIYDYTFLCALHPDLRPKWAKRMSELLSPSGHLVCLEFPLHKPPKAPGPPHGLTSSLYEQLLHTPGQPVAYNSEGYVVEESKKNGQTALVRIAHWLPKRSHANSQGKDMVSIWRHSS